MLRSWGNWSAWKFELLKSGFLEVGRLSEAPAAISLVSLSRCVFMAPLKHSYLHCDSLVGVIRAQNTRADRVWQCEGNSATNWGGTKLGREILPRKPRGKDGGEAPPQIEGKQSGWEGKKVSLGGGRGTLRPPQVIWGCRERGAGVEHCLGHTSLPHHPGWVGGWGTHVPM